MHPTGPIAQRFPLVARPRPACLPLTARVGQLSELADTAARQTDQGLASTVFNQAALLASDVGLPGYARELCHRHSNLYLTHTPLPAAPAIRALEPLVNLARLRIRAGRHQHGHQLLLELYQAVTTGTGTVIDGITVPANLASAVQELSEVRAWLWRVVLADGARALTSAGRWTDALRHIQDHRGIGRRILDGRQVAVLAFATKGDRPGALALLEATEPGAPWEDAVTAVLTALCRPGDQRAADSAADHCLALEPGDGLAAFTTRLALTAIDAAGPTTTTARPIIDHLAHRTSEIRDGYALRDLLAHPSVRHHLEPVKATELEHALASCALASGELPAPLTVNLNNALTVATAVIDNSFH